MMRRLRWLIYVQPLGRIVCFMVLLILIWGFLGSRCARQKWWKILNFVTFLCGLSAVIYLTIGTRETNTQEVILTPFQSFVEAKENREMYRSMLMNIFLFVPLGLSLPNVLPRRWHPAANVCLAMIFGFALSAVIEWCQYRYGLGRCEVDDVIMNTLGTAIGALSYVIARILERRKKR